MCGRYRIKDPARIREILALVADGDMTLAEVFQRWNIHPEDLEKILHGSPEGSIVTTMRWGLVPFWDKSPRPKIAPINVRSGEAFAKPIFRQSIQKRRCLVPADGFYEWPKAESGLRQPSFFSLLDERPFFFAGIFEEAMEGVRPATYSIFTTEPNGLLSKLPHDRMPVILEPDAARAWNAPGPLSESAFGEFCRPFTAEKMQSWPVSSFVNRPQNDDPRCCERVDAEPPPPPKPKQTTFDF